MKPIDSMPFLEEEILRLGFLPFFKNEIEGFSVEEMTDKSLWFADGIDGPWEWKGPIAERKKCVYGKFFRGRAGFISLDLFPDFANYRRDGYDMDARYDDGLASASDLKVWQRITECGTVLSKDLKTSLGFGKGGKGGFEAIITRLQMQTYVNICAFDYMTDKKGNTYGWGVARYSVPEHWLGVKSATGSYGIDPKNSYEKLLRHLIHKLPSANEKLIKKLLG